MDKVVHFEIPASDLARAKKFYSTLFGWQTMDSPENGYCLLNTVETEKNGLPKTAGAINGGLIKKTKQASAPIIVVKVKSIAEHLQKAQKMGVKVAQEKTAMGPIGFYARITDSEGNLIALWQDAIKSNP